MARTLGIPSRVAVGYTPGRLRSDGWYSVLGKQLARLAGDLVRRHRLGAFRADALSAAFPAPRATRASPPQQDDVACPSDRQRRARRGHAAADADDGVLAADDDPAAHRRSSATRTPARRRSRPGPATPTTPERRRLVVAVGAAGDPGDPAGVRSPSRPWLGAGTGVSPASRARSSASIAAWQHACRARAAGRCRRLAGDDVARSGRRPPPTSCRWRRARWRRWRRSSTASSYAPPESIDPAARRHLRPRLRAVVGSGDAHRHRHADAPASGCGSTSAN